MPVNPAFQPLRRSFQPADLTPELKEVRLANNCASLFSLHWTRRLILSCLLDMEASGRRFCRHPSYCDTDVDQRQRLTVGRQTYW